MCFIGMGKFILVLFWSVPAREHQRLVLGGRELEDSSNKHSKQVTAFQMFFPMLQTLKDILLNGFISEDGLFFLSGKHSGVEPEN